jgi:low affinity Fe/Cu permease
LSLAARRIVEWVGSGAAAAVSLALVLVWTAIGAVAGFTEHWLEALFAVSGAVTFVMVFFIQHSTARDLRAILIKLDELIAVDDRAHDDVVSAEKQTLGDQEELEDRVRERATGRSAPSDRSSA